MAPSCFVRTRVASHFSRFACVMLALAGTAFSHAATPPPPPKPDKVLLDRAEKIVAAIVTDDAAKAVRVRDIVARQYAELRLIHEVRDASLKAAKSQAGADAAAAEAATKLARDLALARQAELRFAYQGRLAAELTPAQVEQVKDGMTYGVLPLTFRVYNDMLPNLTAEQKAQIYAWLVEAREYAMDSSSSDEKHGWFGKYKGKVNNYLAAAGINMKQAEKDLAARRKAASPTGK